MELSYVSGFSGIGGFELGIQRILPNARCVGWSDIDPHAIEVYSHRFPDHPPLGDITAVDADDLPPFELFVGGFPCQSFSIMGKGAGMDDARGTLFFDIARILKARRPANFILENVKGLMSHDQGRTFGVILRTLDELGYAVEWQVLDSRDFGLPQARQRVYIVGHHGGLPPWGPALRFPAAPRHHLEEVTRGTSIGHRVYQPAAARTLASQGGGGGALTGLYIDPVTGGVRKLTPREAERCQGFPDDWTFGTDTNRYRRIGNAVSVPVVESIVRKIYPPFRTEMEELL